jgi:hypothetical protein
VRTHDERAELARDRLAEALAEQATLALGGTRWGARRLPTEHKIYAIVLFAGTTVYAGGAQPHHAKRALARELVRLAEL